MTVNAAMDNIRQGLNQSIRIATHQSPLALMYTDKVASDIQHLYPHISIELVKVATQSDQFFFPALPDWEGECLFAREVNQALFDGRADIAAHVIEESARANISWSRGWLCMKSPFYEDNSLHFITDLKRIPELLFLSSRSRL